MPTTVNGVGTHYYGKSNRHVRSGACRACGASTQLESYDTRLWFVVIFIPVIPLGRKRIIDQCPRCSRHFVADQAKYEMARQLNVSGVLEQYRSQSTPETALEVHASLLSFHMHGEADTFRKAALLDHAQSAELHVGLASHLEQVGRYNESLPLLEKAYALRPDLPQARVGVARLRMADGKLAEARSLLDFLEQPGAGQLYSLEPLETLALAYQQRGEHDQTVALCQHLIAEVPSVGQVAGFRKFVTVSERALGRTESILPKRSFSLRRMLGGSGGRRAPWLRRLTWVAVIGGVVLLVMAGMNEYWRRNRGVIAVNDCGQPVQLVIDNGAAVQIQGTKFLTLAEGMHHVKISGPVNEEFDIPMATGYFQRFSHDPAWVIMVGQGTVLQEETIHYAAHPRPAQGRLICGRHFYYSPHVDYCFKAPPPSLQMDSKVSEVTKICLRPASQPAHDLIYAVAAEDPAAAVSFAETRLIRDRDDVPLVDAYIQIATAGKLAERARAYLKAGLDRQPISVVWHRAYQDAGKTGQHQAEMEQEYDALSQKSPRDATLLYLAGRVAHDRQKAHELFRKSHATDPTFAWACIALAYDASSCGDWQTCRSMAQAAVAAHSDFPGANQYLREARLALGELDALELEGRQALAGANGNEDIVAILNLCEVLVMRNKRDEAFESLGQWQGRQPAEFRASPVNSLTRMVIQYMAGDFNDVQGGGNGEVDKLSRDLRLHSLLAGGRIKDVMDDESLKELLEDPWNALAASIAWSIAGDSHQASSWREKTAAALDQLDADAKRAAVLLRAANPPGKSQLDDVVLGAPSKSLLVAALIARFPQQKAELAPVAQNLNVSRHPPYHLVRRAIEGAPAN